MVEKVVTVSSTDNATFENLLTRTKSFLEERDFPKAQEYVDRILDTNTQCSMGYLYQLCIKFKHASPEGFATEYLDYYEDPNYGKFIQFASEEEKAYLKEIHGKREIFLARAKKVNKMNQIYREIQELYKDSEIQENIYQAHLDKLQEFNNFEPELTNIKKQIAQLNESAYQNRLKKVFPNETMDDTIGKYFIIPRECGAEIQLNDFFWLMKYSKRAVLLNSEKTPLLEESSNLIYQLATKLENECFQEFPLSIHNLYFLILEYKDASNKIEEIKRRCPNYLEIEKDSLKHHKGKDIKVEIADWMFVIMMSALFITSAMLLIILFLGALADSGYSIISPIGEVLRFMITNIVWVKIVKPPIRKESEAKQDVNRKPEERKGIWLTAEEKRKMRTFRGGFLTILVINFILLFSCLGKF